MNELDFAASLHGEARGAQGAGWATTITAHEVYEELAEYIGRSRPLSKAELRIAMLLYCQLAEAGGVYETLKNMLRVVTLKPYLLWPFHDLVRVKKAPKRIIGPNANATFRDLAATAEAVGFEKLSYRLEIAFHDDIRNGICHADYVIWSDGLRLRNRNGGNAKLIPYDELSEMVGKGAVFFDLLQEYSRRAVESFNPPKVIVGRLSANPPMPWKVAYDPTTGSFQISGSAPCSMTTPEYERQATINGLLGGKVLAIYTPKVTATVQSIIDHIHSAGFGPNIIEMSDDQFVILRRQIDESRLWDFRTTHPDSGEALLVSPWGFRWLAAPDCFDNILSKPLVEI